MLSGSGIVGDELINSRPTQWFTPTRGLLYSNDKVRATNATDTRGAPMPGPGNHESKNPGVIGGL